MSDSDVDDPDVSEAAARLVRLKHSIDAERRSEGQLPVSPSAFIGYSLPYAGGGPGDRSSSEIACVRSDLVVGATWAPAWSELPSGDAAESLCDRLDSFVYSREEG